jgi:hypothetical protein
MSTCDDSIDGEAPLADSLTLQAWSHAQRVAGQARRIVFARRQGPLWGCFAGIIASCGAAGALDDLGLNIPGVWGLYMLPFALLTWRIARQPSANTDVVDQAQDAARTDPRGWRLYRILAMSVTAGMGVFWLFVFPHMTTEVLYGFLLALGALLVAWYVAMFVRLRLWEMLLCAASVALAWSGYLYGQSWPPLRGVAAVAPALALLAIVLLLRRFRDLSAAPRESEP